MSFWDGEWPGPDEPTPGRVDQWPGRVDQHDAAELLKSLGWRVVKLRASALLTESIIEEEL